MGLAWHLASRPQGLPTASNFELKEFKSPPVEEGMIRVRNRWLSVDPHMRSRMDEAQPFVKFYYPPYVVGAPLEGGAVGEVVESRAEGFAPGDLVGHYQGWREESVLPAAYTWDIPADGVPEQAYIGLLGHTGATAYFGFRKAEPKAGEVIFVSGAAGAVGSTVVQLAKIKGMTVIGSTGGAKKCALVRELGADAVIDYKSDRPVLDQLKEVAPDGIDVYFDNVGGGHLDAALALAREHARFSILGTIENYNSGEPTALRYLLNVVTQRIRIEGVVATDYVAEFPTFRQELTGYIKDGRLTLRETVREGLEAMPGALIDLFTGASVGKMVVRV
jgi:NADPH-dependent curcumin reductase CurA